MFNTFSFKERSPVSNPNFSPKNFLEAQETRANGVSSHVIAQDIFDFGFLMLKCAIGDLDFFGISDFTNKLKIFIEEYIKRPEERHKFCCVVHDEDAISSISLPSGDEKDKNKGRRGSGNFVPFHVSIKDFLAAGNFSKNFKDFLCCCLRFDPNQRFTASSLLNSAFLQDKKTAGPLTTLTEVLQTSTQLGKNAVLPEKYQVASEKQLDKLCNALAVLLSHSIVCDDGNEGKKTRGLEKLTLESAVIQDLACDLGLTPKKVLMELRKVVREL